MRAEILAVGSELTSGHTVNGNAAYLAQRLQTLGIPCARHTAVGDDHGAIVEALREAMARCELVVVTGGLGPTVDDTTVEAIARATGRPLALVPAVVRRVSSGTSTSAPLQTQATFGRRTHALTTTRPAHSNQRHLEYRTRAFMMSGWVARIHRWFGRRTQELGIERCEKPVDGWTGSTVIFGGLASPGAFDL